MRTLREVRDVKIPGLLFSKCRKGSMLKSMKIAGAATLFLLLIFLGVRLYGLISQEGQLSANLADIQLRLAKAKADESDLQSEAQYLADPVNLEKELRGRFNYKNPGETVVIIVPPAATSTASSTTH